MGILNDLNQNGAKTADYFINSKVDDLIERSVVEGKKRKQMAKKIADECSDPNTHVGMEYLTSIADFSEFPKYSGRGIQDTSPDINDNTLTMWYSEVDPKEVELFIAQIVNEGFLKNGADYIKQDGRRKLTISISTSKDKLRIFYMRG